MSMLAMFLIATGLGDVMRRFIGTRWVPPVLAVVVLVVGSLLAGLWHLGDLQLLVIASVAVVGWNVACERTEVTGTRQGIPLVIIGGAVTALILLSGWASDVGGAVGRWVAWAELPESVSAGRVLMVLGVMLVQLTTANHVVRLVLGSVGAVKPAGQPQASDRLKGGRLLGPMERLLIVGLGLAGQLTMASAVVAAKSVIRFPEINATRNHDEQDTDHVGIDEVVEYFLVARSPAGSSRSRAWPSSPQRDRTSRGVPVGQLLRAQIGVVARPGEREQGTHDRRSALQHVGHGVEPRRDIGLDRVPGQVDRSDDVDPIRADPLGVQIADPLDVGMVA